MIFSRLKAIGADWVYHFPELGIVELTPRDDDPAPSAPGYSVSQSAVAELNAQRRRAEVQRLRAELEEMNAHAREEAWIVTARDRSRVPSGVRPRPSRLAAGVIRTRTSNIRGRGRRVLSSRTYAIGAPDARRSDRDCSGAMARVKATLAALGASRP